MTDLDAAQFADAMSWPRRSGFWRRLVASLIDYLVVLIPVYALVAALFLLTDGGVKGSFWLNWRICQAGTVHGDPSLDRYDWQVCRTSVFGLTVAEWVVGTTSEAQGEKALPFRLTWIREEISDRLRWIWVSSSCSFSRVISLSSSCSQANL